MYCHPCRSNLPDDVEQAASDVGLAEIVKVQAVTANEPKGFTCKIKKDHLTRLDLHGSSMVESAWIGTREAGFYLSFQFLLGLGRS